MARGYWILSIVLLIGIAMGWEGHTYYQQRFGVSLDHSRVTTSALLPDAYTLMQLETRAQAALYQVFLTDPASFSKLRPALTIDIEEQSELNFPDVLTRLHQQAPGGLTLEQLRALARCIGVDGAESLRMLLTPPVYAQWQAGRANKRISE